MKAYVALFPGQGSQSLGMGLELFSRYPHEVQIAQEILGWSVQTLCTSGPVEQLNNTLYTQPALFLVNALYFKAHLEDGGRLPTVAAGLSLGEYSALYAAGVFTFEEGLSIVKRRAELMAAQQGGGMIAVVGRTRHELAQFLESQNLDEFDIANENSATQFVIAGPAPEISRACELIEKELGASAFVLPVSGAFHSRYMADAKQSFDEYLNTRHFNTPHFPVISNVNALPYSAAHTQQLLANQLTMPVKWFDSVVNVAKDFPDIEWIELGPGKTLTNLTHNILKKLAREGQSAATTQTVTTPTSQPPAPALSAAPPTTLTNTNLLGPTTFRERYGVDLSCLAGGMARGIASTRMVTRLAQNNLLGFFGSGGLPLSETETALASLADSCVGKCWGLNLVASHADDALIDLAIKYNVPVVEAAAFVDVTLALVRYRLTTLPKTRGDNNHARARGQARLIVKLSDPAVAARFLSPAPEHMVKALLASGAITAYQASLAPHRPVADDICIEGVSGGHTGKATWLDLLPTIRRQRDDAIKKHSFVDTVHIGAAGGMGSPESVAAAFMSGAQFVVTGSINQCTPEAATSDLVKDMLSRASTNDTDFAPSSDMFEIGSKVQVLKKGLLYPARSKKLYELYNSFSSWLDIPVETRQSIEEKYLRKSFAMVLQELEAARPTTYDLPASDRAKYQMAQVFKWYCSQASRYAQAGDETRKVDFQIWAGPSIGAANHWLGATQLSDWRKRHVDQLTQALMSDAARQVSAFQGV
ncbi:ACP S-malonyltransferase [Pseudomonas syringae group genomosp. 3]|uniref:ACP S-malonyltransferase n=1 Tax=Pseudomonas syringae group genomosp. 3 TaxID=251701 RepID=UPI00070F878A|nr:ACP S-malonyltransferase [Pseudomonas syringae group genomosp. 3]